MSEEFHCEAPAVEHIVRLATSAPDAGTQAEGEANSTTKVRTGGQGLAGAGGSTL